MSYVERQGLKYLGPRLSLLEISWRERATTTKQAPKNKTRCHLLSTGGKTEKTKKEEKCPLKKQNKKRPILPEMVETAHSLIWLIIIWLKCLQNSKSYQFLKMVLTLEPLARSVVFPWHVLIDRIRISGLQWGLVKVFIPAPSLPVFIHLVPGSYIPGRSFIMWTK